MKFKEKYPFAAWFLQRSALYYVMASLIVIFCIDPSIWQYLRLKHLEQLCISTDWKYPYDVINYYEYLTRVGLKSTDHYMGLGRNYLLVNEQNKACEAFAHAKKYATRDSETYQSLAAVCHDVSKSALK